MVETLAPRCGKDPTQIEIKMVGERSGEKIDEDLLTEYEGQYTLDLGDLLAIIPFAELNESYPGIKFNGKIDEAYLNTKNVVFLTKPQIKKMVREVLKEDIID